MMVDIVSFDALIADIWFANRPSAFDMVSAFLLFGELYKMAGVCTVKMQGLFSIELRNYLETFKLYKYLDWL